jgi:hypothetical protein
MSKTKLSAKDGMAFEIQGYIKAGIAKEAAKIADGYKEQIVKDVEDAMSDIVARLSTRLVKYYTVQDMKDHIEIHVRKEL